MYPKLHEQVLSMHNEFNGQSYLVIQNKSDFENDGLLGLTIYNKVKCCSKNYIKKKTLIYKQTSIIK